MGTLQRHVVVEPAFGAAAFQLMALGDLWQDHQGPAEEPTSGAENSDECDSGSSSNSSSEHGADVASSDSVAELSDLRKRMKNQKQTQKARTRAIQAKAVKKLAKTANLNPPEHPAERYRRDVQVTSDLNRQGSVNVRFRRLRLLLSYFKGWCAALVLFFQKFNDQVSHTVLVSVVDDTNIRLAEIPDGAPQWRLSRVMSIMNNIQNLVVAYDEGGNFCHKHFVIHTPFVCLPKSDRDNISAEFVSRLFSFLGKVSSRYHHWNIPADLLKMVHLQGLVLVFDALKANIAMLKQFRQAVYLQYLSGNTRQSQVFPLLAICCLLHQLALARSPILFGFNNYWATVVRLSHLFEGHNFRQQFKAALISVLADSFCYITVLEVPDGVREWKDRRSRIYNCNFRGGVDSKALAKRIRLHLALADWGNSDPSLPSLTHWCRGSCCKGHTPEAKEAYALLQVCKHFVLLFALGFPVPLSYRWVHAERANQYIKETRLHSS